MGTVPTEIDTSDAFVLVVMNQTGIIAADDQGQAEAERASHRRPARLIGEVVRCARDFSGWR